MRETIICGLVYLSGVVINLAIINNCYKENFAYDKDAKSFLKAESLVSYAALPAVIFVCWDSNRKWCN